MLTSTFIGFVYSPDLLLMFPYNVLLQFSVYETLLWLIQNASVVIYPYYTYYVVYAMFNP